MSDVPATGQNAGMSPRRGRELLEAALDESGWIWCRRSSLLLDELVARQESPE
jgi:hypothetical protein